MNLSWKLSSRFFQAHSDVEDGCVVNLQIHDVSDFIVGRAGCDVRRFFSC